MFNPFKVTLIGGSMSELTQMRLIEIVKYNTDTDMFAVSMFDYTQAHFTATILREGLLEAWLFRGDNQTWTHRGILKDQGIVEALYPKRFPGNWE